MVEGGIDAKCASDISGKITRIKACFTLLLWLDFAAWQEQTRCCLTMIKIALSSIQINRLSKCGVLNLMAVWQPPPNGNVTTKIYYLRCGLTRLNLK